MNVQFNPIVNRIPLSELRIGTVFMLNGDSNQLFIVSITNSTSIRALCLNSKVKIEYFFKPIELVVPVKIKSIEVDEDTI